MTNYWLLLFYGIKFQLVLLISITNVPFHVNFKNIVLITNFWSWHWPFC